MEAAPRPKGQGVDEDEWRRHPALRGRVLMKAVYDWLYKELMARGAMTLIHNIELDNLSFFQYLPFFVTKIRLTAHQVYSTLRLFAKIFIVEIFRFTAALVLTLGI